MKEWIASLLAPPYYISRLLYKMTIHPSKKLKTVEQNLILIKNKIYSQAKSRVQAKENDPVNVLIHSYNQMADELFIKLGNEHYKNNFYEDVSYYEKILYQTHQQNYRIHNYLELDKYKLGSNPQEVCIALLSLINKLYEDAEKNAWQESEKHFLKKAQGIVLLAAGTFDCLNEYKDYKYSIEERALMLGAGGIIGSAVTMTGLSTLLITAVGVSLTGAIFLGICLAIVLVAIIVSAALIYHEKSQLGQTLTKPSMESTSVLAYQNLVIQELESDPLLEQVRPMPKNPDNLYPNLIQDLKEIYESESRSLSAIGLSL